MKAKFISEILNERFHDEEFEKKFAAYQRNKSKITIIEKDGDWELVKNPPSLKYFGNGGEVSGITIDGGRGIALKNGDIYIESWSKLTHHSILEILAKHRITKFPDKNWWEDFYSEDIYDYYERFVPSMLDGKSSSGEFRKIVSTFISFDAEEDLDNKSFSSTTFERCTFKSCIFRSVIFQSCTFNDRETGLPRSSGKTSELIVIAKKARWDSNIGDSISSFFEQKQIGLPQDESIFNIVFG
jgi:hypothetical protein